MTKILENAKKNKGHANKEHQAAYYFCSEKVKKRTWIYSKKKKLLKSSSTSSRALVALVALVCVVFIQ